MSQQYKQRQRSKKDDEQIQEQEQEQTSSEVSAEAAETLDDVDALLAEIDSQEKVEIKSIDELLALPEIDWAEKAAIDKDIAEQAEIDKIVADLMAEVAADDAMEQQSAAKQKNKQDLCPCGKSQDACTGGIRSLIEGFFRS